jgi:hypothetical protein
MLMRNILVAMPSLLLLANCASIISGGTDDVGVLSEPPGATCTVTNGATATMVKTPGTAVVRRSSSDLLVSCSEEGYADGQSTMPSGFNGCVLGNLWIGGLTVGVPLDFVTGSAWGYDESTLVHLEKNENAAGS